MTAHNVQVGQRVVGLRLYEDTWKTVRPRQEVIGTVVSVPIAGPGVVYVEPDAAPGSTWAVKVMSGVKRADVES